MTKSCEDHQKSSLTKMTMTENDHNKKTGSPLMERA